MFYVIIMIGIDDWISCDGIYGYCVELDYKLYFLTGGLGLVYRWNSVKFSIDFLVLEYFRNCMSVRSGWDSHSSNEL